MNSSDLSSTQSEVEEDGDNELVVDADVPPGASTNGSSDDGSDSSEDDRNVKYFIPRFSADALDHSLFALMLAIRASVLDGTKLSEELTVKNFPAEHFQQCFQHDLMKAGSDINVHVVDYAPAAFHFIRNNFGVESPAFLLSWSDNEILKAQEKNSELIYSCDKKFVAQPVSEDDVRSFLNLLPLYFKYVHDNPTTFLLRVYGLVGVQTGKKLSHFLLVENVFHFQMPLHQMFHLSGGAGKKVPKPTLTFRGRSQAQKLRSSSGKIATIRRGRSSSLVLDPPRFQKDKSGIIQQCLFGNDDSWREQKRTIMMERALASGFVEQLEADLAFLRDCNVASYQIVVGIHEGETNAPPTPRNDVKKLVKVPSVVVFKGDGDTVIGPGSAVSRKGSHKGAVKLMEGGSSSNSPNFSNLRRKKRVSVRNIDAEKQIASPYRTKKRGMWCKHGNREEVYYVGVIDIFKASKAKKSGKSDSEKLKTKFNRLITLVKDSILEYDPEPLKSAMKMSTPKSILKETSPKTDGAAGTTQGAELSDSTVIPDGDPKDAATPTKAAVVEETVDVI